ncbi:Ubiquinone biosynthesis O-methyltransferase [uncultured archaeon]|nr:Ubiquinone biosynthesis O-methyltransferase [uncultured archaeon]
MRGQVIINMKEFFDEDYFYGNKKSNYICYDEIDPKKYFKNVIEFIEGRKKGGRYLDVGCAFGLLIREVSPFFDEIHGCDISTFAIEKAGKNAPEAKLRIVDLDGRFPYSNGYFDVVTALDVLEHTRNLEKNFEKISASVKDGGCLIVSTPILDWPRKIFGFLDKDKSHISIPSENKLVGIAKKN